MKKTEVECDQIQGIYGVIKIQSGQRVISMQDVWDVDQSLEKLRVNYPVVRLVRDGKTSG